MPEFILTDLFEEVNMGYINFQKHPVLDLFIFNYSKTAQYEKYWTELTLASRGLVLNSNSELVARSLPKFFNLSEIPKEMIPVKKYKVYEKIDGSYVQFFLYKDQLVFSSRGSFTSDQAVKASEIFYKKYSHVLPNIQPGYNYICEIIYPSNRIVVDYGLREDLIMITTINNQTKQDRLIDIGLPMVKEYVFPDLDTLLSMNVDNAEGFIFKYESINDVDPIRLKFKFAEYIRLHRVLTTCSTRDIWNILRNRGNFEEILERVPDEFYDWVENTVSTLRNNYDTIEQECFKRFKPIQLLIFLRNLPHIVDKDKILSKKQAAAYILKQKKYQSVVFAMYYGMKYDQIIWEMVEPKWEKPFLNATINNET